MGGDFAPKNEILGANLAFLQLQKIENLQFKIVLFGLKSKIELVAQENAIDLANFEIIDAPQVIDMHDDPTEIIKTKKDSSLYLGLTSLKARNIDAFVSGGNTGAMLALSTILLGRLPGVSRPTIASFLPSANIRPTLLLDVGATVDHKTRFLVEYALMGSTYYNVATGVENPSIGLLNVGEEDSKGTDVLKESYKILKNSNLNFVGNVEGRDILMGKTNVVVCDGYVGNVILKFAESFINLLKSKMKNYSEKSLINKMKVAASIPAIKGVFKEFDYQEYGGVPILGVNGISIVGHGKSSPIAYFNMILKAKELIESSLLDKIEKSINNNNFMI